MFEKTASDQEPYDDPGVSMPAAHWAGVSRPSHERFHHIAEGEKIPTAIQTTLAAVAASIIYSAAGMSRWGLAELTLGLYKVYCRHNREHAMDTISGLLVTSMRELQDISHWLNWARAAYMDKKDLLALEVGIQVSDIIKHETTSAVGRPAYFLALNHSKKAVVLCIRGTSSATDVLTDLQPHSESFEDGFAHSGMLASARWFLDNREIMDKIRELMASHGYRLVVTGHSLGAGAASLLAMLLRETNQAGLTVLGIRPEVVTCWGYGCPPCVDKMLAEKATFIKNIVHQDDIVSRISPAALEDLRLEIEQTDWTHALDADSRRRKIVELAQTSRSLIRKIEPALNYEEGALYAEVKDRSWAGLMSVGNNIAQQWTKASKGAYGFGTQQSTSWLSKGITFATAQVTSATKQATVSVSGAVTQQLRLIDPERKDAAVTAATMSAQAAVANQKAGRAFLESNRLFVPGVLYHVMHRPLKEGENDPTKHPKEARQSCATKASYRCLVIRGDTHSSRFGRIVLSSTMISDHLCPPLQEALENAMKWELAGSTKNSRPS